VAPARSRGIKRWGLSAQALTPAAAQVAAQAGVLASFAEASQQILKTMSGLSLGESTVERTTEDAGQRVIERLEEGRPQGPQQSWPWQRDAQGQTCAYVGMDHTGIRQQGPGGARADGRMAGVAMVYNPRSDHDERKPPRRQVRYIAGFSELDELGRQLRREAEAVREVYRQQVTYFRNHAHRMDYPTYVANGWQIGSGPVESACKTVVGNRLKGGGMRWGHDGANAVCHLRAVYLSDPTCWNSLWYQQAA